MKNILKNITAGCILSIVFFFQVSASPNIDGIMSYDWTTKSNEWDQTGYGYILDFGRASGVNLYDLTLNYGYHNFIEAGINLDELSNRLAGLFDNNKAAIGFDRVRMHYTMEGGNDLLQVSATYNYSQTPEPTTLFLFGIGLLGLGAFRKRKTKHKI